MKNSVWKSHNINIWKNLYLRKGGEPPTLLFTPATNPDAQVPKSDFHLGEENLQNPPNAAASASAGKKPWITNKQMVVPSKCSWEWMVFEPSEWSPVTRIWGLITIQLICR